MGILRSHAPPATILVRILVGWVFHSEGIQKFLFPAALGAGRFAKIGIPDPQFFGPFVGVVEIVCGGLLILGFLTRLAAIPLLIDITVAILKKSRCSKSPAFGQRCTRRARISACGWDRCFS